MKKLIIVSKTHLDLGFTDYAENIKNKYINFFIPSAISLAKELNKNGKKNFVWTTGSWILKEALEKGSEEQKKELFEAIKRGDIAPHAMPFTTHTELFDRDTLSYGLSIVKDLDKIRGRKTTAAKVTDVPGHTRGIVKALSENGIKLLHIGVNGASAIPEVPPCFLWKDSDSEIVVIYSGSYGSAFKTECTEEILYFDHTLDNHGAPAAQAVLKKISRLKKEYPDYEITAGCLDDYGDIIWEKRSSLPVFTGEIGDTWIHGSASDPYKTGALRELISLKSRWLAEGTMKRETAEYKSFCDYLLCVGEHTWGPDMKMFFADYENYLKEDFIKARKADKVVMRHPFRDFPQNFNTLTSRIFGSHHKGSYKAMELGWREQRQYITSAVNSLSAEHKKQAQESIKKLIPSDPQEITGTHGAFSLVKCGSWTMRINSKGGIGLLSYNGDEVIKENEKPIIEYRSYSKSDYDFWLTHYSRDLKHTGVWAVGDFARPLLKYAEGKYITGRFPYNLQKAAAEFNENTVKTVCNLICDKKLCDTLGAPRLIQIIYTLSERGLKINVSWFNKDANRLTEAIFLRLYPGDGSIALKKLGEEIIPGETVSMGGRNLHAVWETTLKTKDGEFSFINRHSPLISIGKGKILEFDNKFEDFRKDGITYVLYDNVWGTNFPLWYEDNAGFEFEIRKK